MRVEFHHGALCDDYEKQANAQGFLDFVTIVVCVITMLVKSGQI